MDIKKLAIITTHPIQYNAPLFKIITNRGKIQIKVFYTWEQEASYYDERFGKQVKWDIPLLDGYDYKFVSNNGVSKRSFFDLKNPSLIRNIIDWGADSVMVYGWNFLSHLRAMIYFKDRIPVLFRGDSTLLNDKKGVRRIIRRIALNWIYKNIDYALCVGKNNREYFLKHGIKREHIVFVPHAIDNARFGLENDDLLANVHKLKTELVISDAEMVFIYAGKFYEVKDLFTLITAFKKVPNKNVRLILFGNGNQEKKLRELAADDERITFTGFRNQSEMPIVYRVGDVFILPSKSETWGLSVNEAMACGKAILVSDRVGCAPDLVIPDYNGHIFPTGNIDVLASCLSSMSEKTKVKSMGSASKLLVLKWSYEKQVEEIETLLANILA